MTTRSIPHQTDNGQAYYVAHNALIQASSANSQRIAERQKRLAVSTRRTMRPSLLSVKKSVGVIYLLFPQFGEEYGEFPAGLEASMSAALPQL
jgi:hypothetical protein